MRFKACVFNVLFLNAAILMPSIVDDVSNRRHTHGSTMCEMSHVAFLYKFKENKSKLRKSHLGVAQIVA
jgi:hypothetical protein